jgi:hypothetical protein
VSRSGRFSTRSVRPSCVCHGVPMRPRNDRITNPWRCAVKANVAQSKQNPKRITVGRTYLGTENRFPAPREAVVQFARGLIEAHRKEIA